MSNAVVKVEQGGALVAPEFVKMGDSRGHEGIEQGDLILPRLAVAQPTSPELQKGNPKHIAGLTAGDMFNTVTRESYGSGPVRVVIVRREKPRAVEFAPLAAGGGVLDRAVALTDPRCQWGPNNEKPVATIFREYVAFLSESCEPIVLSFKGTSINAAKMLNTLLEMPFKGQPVAYFARVYAVTTSLKSNDKGAFYVFGVVQDGWTPEAEYKFAETQYENFKGVNLAVDDTMNPDTESSEKTPF